MILFIAAALFFLGVMVYDNSRFVIRKYEIRSPKVSRKLTFVFMSDLHNKDYGNDNEKLVKAIDSIRPDLVLIGGDMIVSRQAGDCSTPEELEACTKIPLTFLKALSERYDVYYAEGNHETALDDESTAWVYQKHMEDLDAVGIKRLHNRYAQPFPDMRLRLYGLDLPMEIYRKILPYHMPEGMPEETAGKLDPSFFNLVLAHSPKFFPEYASWGADLVLSGHVHGGLMRIGRLGFIGPDLHLFPKYNGGLYKSETDGQCTMIVTCGIGAHTLPIRIFNPGEISCITIRPEEDGGRT